MKYFIVLLITLHSLTSLAEDRIQILSKHLNSNAAKCLVSNNKSRCVNGRKSKHQGTGWCYRYVKLGLLRAGLVSKYLGGGSAVNAGPHLSKEGFINIMKQGQSPAEAPVGSILIFKVKTNKHGHIEVKTNRTTYVSDYIRYKHPRDYELIGVYYKFTMQQFKPSTRQYFEPSIRQIAL